MGERMPTREMLKDLALAAARGQEKLRDENARLRAALAGAQDECGRWSAAFEEARIRQNQTNADLATARDQIGRYALSLRKRDDELTAQGARLVETEAKAANDVLVLARAVEELRKVGRGCADERDAARAELAAVAGERDAMRAALVEIQRIYYGAPEDILGIVAAALALAPTPPAGEAM